ncbi:MAG: ribonuclease E/G [Neomegalonema sp.]|nr:ribonuclease E/G [Neomegalonema sp.]
MTAERRILVDDRGGREIAALIARGALQDLLVAAERAGPQVGEIWAARIDKPASRSAGGGYFLDLGGMRAFLPGGGSRSPGEPVKVEITRAAEADDLHTKAAAATEKLNFAGPYLAHTPSTPGVNVSRKISDPAERARLAAALAGLEQHGGFVLRTAAAGRNGDLLRGEAEAQLAAAAEIQAAPPLPPRRLRAAPGLVAQARTLWPDATLETAAPGLPADERPLARRGLEAELARLLSPKVDLTGPGLSGAWMACERPAAAVVIDVNAGASRSAQAVNLAALAEIPRQLRLRGWGGQILIDLAAIDRGRSEDAEKARARYIAALKAAADPPLRVLGFGPLGMLEARRNRDRTPIETLLAVEDLSR